MYTHNPTYNKSNTDLKPDAKPFTPLQVNTDWPSPHLTPQPSRSDNNEYLSKRISHLSSALFSHYALSLPADPCPIAGLRRD